MVGYFEQFNFINTVCEAGRVKQGVLCRRDCTIELHFICSVKQREREVERERGVEREVERERWREREV